MNITDTMSAVRQRKGTKAPEVLEECLLQETNWKSSKKYISGKSYKQLFKMSKHPLCTIVG